MFRLFRTGRRHGAFLYPGAEIGAPAGGRHGASERVSIEGQAKAAVEVGRQRLAVTAGVFALAFCVIGARLVDLMALNGGAEAARFAAGRDAVAAPVVQRADIVDRNGVILATNLPTTNLYANATRVIDPAETARRLIEVLPGLSFEETLRKLSSGKTFVYLHRNLTPYEKNLVNRLGLPGLEFQAAERRVYPHGRLASHVLGATNIDNAGIAGIERTFDSRLDSGTAPVRLSLDIRVQHAVHAVLSQAIARFRAIAGVGVVADARTGEILAMVSLPDYEPRAYGRAEADARFNRATLGVYEMGSTFKLMNTAMGLEVGGYRLSDGFDASQPLHMAGFTIRDYHAQNRWLSIPEILVHSSNIGSARLALSVGGEAQKAFLSRLGLLSPLAIELPEVGDPLYPNPWRPINTVTISYGHGIAVTPVHLVKAVSALVNGGIVRPATLLRREPDDVPAGRPAVSAATSAAMRDLMRLVVTDGTGRQADVPGYRVGGKTGTAEKVVGRGYGNTVLMPSFVAAFPIDDPRYVVLVTLDEPKGIPETHNFATAGWNAAPTAGAIIERVAPLLGVMPTRDVILTRDRVRLAAAEGAARATE